MHISIGKEISILYRQFNIYITRELKDLNIMPSEYIFIVNIDEGKSCNQQEICDSFVIDKSLATRAIKSLVEKGFIERLKNPDDKREYLLKLTERGKEVKPIIVQKLTNWTDILTEGLSQEEIDERYSNLEIMSQNALKENTNVRK
ncbi:MAG: MarR family transcriptional regulator [Sphaerochaetaceae bacterium]|nr:MarR family transcriptional regulator [Sphaerochaetaceae bacterium]